MDHCVSVFVYTYIYIYIRTYNIFKITHTHSHTHSYARILILFIYRYARAFRCLIIMHWNKPRWFQIKIAQFWEVFNTRRQRPAKLSVNMKFLLQTYKLTLCKYIQAIFVMIWYLLWINWLWFGSQIESPIWTNITLCLWSFLSPLLFFCFFFFFFFSLLVSFSNERNSWVL